MTSPWWNPLLCAQPVRSVEDWWAWHCSVQAPHPLARAALASAGADRLASAFTSGYQAALERLFGERVLGALAVTEAGGGHPRAVQATLEDGLLTGTKTFVTMGSAAEVVWVVARVGETEGRPVLKVVRVTTGGAGQTWSSGPTPPFVPEVPHQVLHLRGASGAVLEGDGYLDVVKPFRTVEDIHVLAAALGFGLGEAARGDVDAGWRDAALAALIGLEPLAAANPREPSVHLALEACFARARVLLDQAPWSDLALWERDRRLLDVAAGVRKRRLERARELLGRAQPC